MSARTISPASATTATLPVSLRGADGPVADLVVVDGTSGWTDRLRGALARGPRGALLIDPRTEDAATVRALAGSGSRIALGERYAGNPAIAALLEQRPEPLAAPGAITGAVTGPDRKHAALELLRLLRALGLRVAELRRVDAAGATLLLGRSNEGASIALHAIEGGRERAELRIRSFAGVATLELPPATSARPALVRIVDEAGERMLPTIYETAERAALRALVAEEASAADALGGLADDLELLAGAAGVA